MSSVAIAIRIGILINLANVHKAISNDTSRNKFQKDVQPVESELKGIKGVQA